MPLYAYVCDACEAGFEQLVRASDTPQCPQCGSEKLTQQVARICNEIKYPAIAKSWRRAPHRAICRISARLSAVARYAARRLLETYSAPAPRGARA